MKKILICLFTLLAIAANAKNNKIYNEAQVKVTPHYSGGDKQLNSYIEKHKHIPDELQDSTISGRVIISFIINKTGETSDFQITNSLLPVLDTQALQIVQSLPRKWTPGKIKSRTVNVRKSIDITYEKPINLSKFSRDIDIDQMPIYPGGDLQFFHDLEHYIKYPEQASDQELTGRVYVSFTVDETGNIVDISVVRGVHPLLDEAAIKGVQSLHKKWTPALKDNKPQKVSFTIPINFYLGK